MAIYLLNILNFTICSLSEVILFLHALLQPVSDYSLAIAIRYLTLKDQTLFIVPITKFWCSQLERPDPVDITTKNVTARSVVLAWKANFQGNNGTKFYNLTYFVVGGKSGTTMQKRFFSNTTSYNLTSLKPYSNYTFEITAENDIGVSDVASAFAQTKEDSK